MDEIFKSEEEWKQNILRELDPKRRWQLMVDFLNWGESKQLPEERRNRPRWRDDKGRIHFY
jgi:hypothetical protein